MMMMAAVEDDRISADESSITALDDEPVLANEALIDAHKNQFQLMRLQWLHLKLSRFQLMRLQRLCFKMNGFQLTNILGLLCMCDSCAWIIKLLGVHKGLLHMHLTPICVFLKLSMKFLYELTYIICLALYECVYL